MRVMCVKEGNNCEYNDGAPAPPGPKIEVGSIYTVCGVMRFSDGDYYFLEGFPRDVCYYCVLFATLPDTPTEMIEEEETELVTA